MAGVIASVAGLITSAANTGGFQGLAGRFKRDGLLHFGVAMTGDIRLSRLDTGQAVELSHRPQAVPRPAALATLMQQTSTPDAEAAARLAFADARQGWVSTLLIEHADDPALITLVNRDQAAAAGTVAGGVRCRTAPRGGRDPHGGEARSVHFNPLAPRLPCRSPTGLRRDEARTSGGHAHEQRASSTAGRRTGRDPHPVTQRAADEMLSLEDPCRLFRCRTLLNCTDVCPKGLNPARAIGKIKEMMVRRSL